MEDKKKLYELYFLKNYSIEEIIVYFNYKYSYSVIRTAIRKILESK